MILDRQLVVLFLLGVLLSTMASAPQPLSGGSNEWECTSNSSNIEYSVEKCNKTNKLILKVKITDDYVVNISQFAPPPVEEFPVTTEDFFKSIILQHYDDSSDSYEYLEEIEIHDHLTIPLPPKAVTEAASVSDSLPESEEWAPQDWSQFCLAAEDEDDGPLNLPDGQIHPKYHEILGVGYYRFHTKPRKWEEARQICEKEGAHLVIINSEEEADALLLIHARCPRILPTHFNSYSYVGVHDNYMEGQFETIFGEPLDKTGYVKWNFGQPDNSHHFGENCVSMNRRGFFNDVPCDTELPYFCEHN
ncbi:uncharacterized protein [Anabrus simplex]|uniref:uncharacterized protein n=1 Tax=Anabrus simplex TaxID=316456 RepID=UPI0035A306A7